MSSTYSPDLRIELIGTGDQAGVWGATTNTNLGTVLEQAIAGYTSVSISSANQALTVNNGASDQSRNAAIALTTVTGANFAVYIPPSPKLNVFYNASSYTATVYCSTVAGNTTAAGTGIAIPAGKKMALWTDGTNVYQQSDYLISPTLSSPTMTSPVLGTPASGTLTNCTGLPVSTGVSGLGAGVATALAVNVGTAGSPVVNGGALGTPSSGTLTNATGLPISTGVSGLGTGVATFLATPSSANLASAVTDETGSGALVFANSPTLTGTPTLPSGTIATTQTYGDSSTKLATTAFVQAALQLLYPIGSIYSGTVSTNPGTLFGFGTWVAFGSGRVLLGAGGGYTAGTTGGSADAIVVSHTHTASSSSSFTGNALSGHSHGLTDPGHNHTFPTYYGYVNGSNVDGVADLSYRADKTTSTSTTGISVNSASAGTPSGSVSTSTTVDSTGSSGTGANLPPYVVVYMWNRTA